MFQHTIQVTDIRKTRKFKSAAFAATFILLDDVYCAYKSTYIRINHSKEPGLVILAILSALCII